jgi:Bacteriophage HK97-gp10, putative tail-component
MPNKLVLGGFTELRAELVALPETLNRDSEPILLRYARATQALVVAAYPRVTGRLRDGVRVVERTARGLATLYTLVTSAPYAHIFEFGSVHQRPRATFLPISETGRRQAVVAVAGMVESKGLVVRGAHD